MSPFTRRCRGRPWHGSDLHSQLEDVMEPSQVAALEALSDFQFVLGEEHLEYAAACPDAPDAFSRERLEALSRFVRHIAKSALALWRA